MSPVSEGSDAFHEQRRRHYLPVQCESGQHRLFMLINVSNQGQVVHARQCCQDTLYPAPSRSARVPIDANSVATSLPLRARSRPPGVAPSSCLNFRLRIDIFLLQQQPDLAPQLTLMKSFLSSILGTKWRLPSLHHRHQSSLEGVSTNFPPQSS
jgi:hypothetical protein